jgi:hypothetical protein
MPSPRLYIYLQARHFLQTTFEARSERPSIITSFPASIQNQTSIEIEKFAAADLSDLRGELLQAGLDSRQVAELIRSFLTQRGYGVCFDASHSAALNSTVLFGPLQRIQETLEQVAVLM